MTTHLASHPHHASRDVPRLGRGGLALVLVAGLVAACAAPGTGAPSPSSPGTTDGAAVTLQRDFVDVVNTVAPSVVVIETPQGLGSGIVYDTKGDIVTNQHVISGASRVKVKFSDGSTYSATVVGSDSATDIAVVHVNAPSSKLVPLTLADSSKVAVGDGVVAIGNPFGLDGTVTSGIVSAVGREISSPDDTPIAGAIQTDAAINHGNSGGPLLNLRGEVIGITSQIQSEGGGNDGVGFAVPSNTVTSIATQLISSGKAQHALLGVTPADTANGVRIATVKSGSAADDAGLKQGDVITAVGRTRITSSAQIRALIAGKQPGDALTLSIKRDGSSKTVHVTLGSRS